MFGLVAACTFTLIGWRKWGDLPVTAVTVVVIGANVTTTLASVLMLHVGFHGRLIALYQGNLQRVQFLSKLLRCVCWCVFFFFFCIDHTGRRTIKIRLMSAEKKMCFKGVCVFGGWAAP